MSQIDTALRELVLRLVREDAELRREISAIVGAADAPIPIAVAADLANVSSRTIARGIASGDLPATGRGRLTRIRRADVIAWLERDRRAVDDDVDPERLAELEEVRL